MFVSSSFEHRMSNLLWRLTNSAHVRLDDREEAIHFLEGVVDRRVDADTSEETAAVDPRRLERRVQALVAGRAEENDAGALPIRARRPELDAAHLRQFVHQI